MVSLLLFFPIISAASAPLDMEAHFETIGILPPIDNSNGIYAEILFPLLVQSLQEICLLPIIELKAYQAIIEKKTILDLALSDNDVLSHIAESAQVDTLLRTQILKNPTKIVLIFDWFKYRTHFERLGSVTTSISLQTLDDTTDAFAVTEKIKQATFALLEELIEGLPFIGFVSGVDKNLLTLQFFLKKSMPLLHTTVNCATIKEKKQHPLKKEVPFWVLEEIGKADVQQIESHIVFATPQNQKNPIHPYAKITTFETPLPAPKLKNPSSLEEDPPPSIRYGRIGMSPQLGSYNLTQQVNTTLIKASSISIGAKNDLLLYFNKKFFGQFKAYTHSSTLKINTTGPIKQTLWNISITLGSEFPWDQDPQEPKAWASVGYKFQKSILATTSQIGPLQIGSFIGNLGGALPLSSFYSLEFNSTLRLFGSTSASWLNQNHSITAVHDFGMDLSLLWKISTAFTGRLTIEISEMSFLFQNTHSVQETQLFFMPGIFYLF